jgi:hypothetical protein
MDEMNKSPHRRKRDESTMSIARVGSRAGLAFLLFCVVTCGEKVSPPVIKDGGVQARDEGPRNPDQDARTLPVDAGADPGRALPTFADSRHKDLPTHELPNSWYCRWGEFEQDGKIEDPMAKRSDPRWEQRAMDIFSWDSFLALNWPYEYVQGKWTHQALPSSHEYTSGREYRPRWGTWWTSAEMRQMMQKPDLELSLLRSENDDWRCEGGCLAGALQGGGHDDKDVVWDRNGERVYYEVRINDSMVDTLRQADWTGAICESGRKTSNKERKLTLTWGQCANHYPKQVEQDGRDQFDFAGAVEIKLAWKVLGKGDIPERFYTMSDVVLEPGRAPVQLGLVGMHIMTKAKTQGRYIWSTFEHVDNVRANPIGNGRHSTPSFYDLGCTDCCPNRRPGESKTVHLTRTEPIHADTEALNREVRAWLVEQGSIWQHYELIGTQYLKANGDEVTPTRLRNVLIEPYFVPPISCMANDDAGSNRRIRDSNCIGCHGKIESYDLSFLARDLSEIRCNGRKR